jgi:hypothetical protein
LHHLDDVPIAEGLRSSDLTAPQVEQPQPGEAHPLTPYLGIVALLGPSLVLVGRVIVRDDGNQIGLGQGAVIVDSARPGGDGFDVTTGRADPLQLRRATIRPIRQEEDPLRVRCPSRRQDLHGAPVSCRGGSLPSARAIHSALNGSSSACPTGATTNATQRPFGDSTGVDGVLPSTTSSSLSPARRDVANINPSLQACRSRIATQ